ncbi:hypothetical protein SDC9_143921 [bioreactor metagenome]|uniref:Uncharacterized protein n=1 Tax=bioreactor metagenome TaxID=1076179 RepID=A0A645E5H0_9ZZZZ
MFLETLNKYPNNDHKFFYFNDYIVEISGDNYRFGVERGGHSGGYWFEPTITEMDDKLIFSGHINYIDFYSNDKWYEKVVTKTEEGCLIIILFPLCLLIKIYALIRLIIRKIRRQPSIKEETTEDRLFNLMENLLNCTLK